MGNDAYQLFALVLVGTVGLAAVIVEALWAALVAAEAIAGAIRTGHAAAGRLAVVPSRSGRRDAEAPGDLVQWGAPGVDLAAYDPGRSWRADRPSRMGAGAATRARCPSY